MNGGLLHHRMVSAKCPDGQCFRCRSPKGAWKLRCVLGAGEVCVRERLSIVCFRHFVTIQHQVGKLPGCGCDNYISQSFCDKKPLQDRGRWSCVLAGPRHMKKYPGEGGREFYGKKDHKKGKRGKDRGGDKGSVSFPCKGSRWLTNTTYGTASVKCVSYA